MEVSFEALRRVQLGEKRSPMLTQLSDDFYSRYSAFIREQQAELQKGFSLEAASVCESTRMVLKDVWHRRQHKLAVKALADAHSGEAKADGLAAEEQRLYNALFTLFQQGEAVLSEAASSTVECGKAEEADNSPEAARVRVLADLPAFVGPDGQSHGPFKAGEVAALPPAAAALLQRRGAAEQLAQAAVAQGKQA